MRVLLIGSEGRVGQIVLDQLENNDDYVFTRIDKRNRSNQDVTEADITNYDEIRPIFADHDAVIHLASYVYTPYTVRSKPGEIRNVDAWSQTLETNIIGMHNVLKAATDADVKKFINTSSNRVVGMYEQEHKPDIYESDFEMKIDHTVPYRPDSMYGASKAFGEIWCKYFSELKNYPEQFYNLRLGSVREKPFNHPFGDAEQGVMEGRWGKNSDEYANKVKRMKCTWLSHRDLAQLIKKCLTDKDVTYGTFYGISNNKGSWFDLEPTRNKLGYSPNDKGEEWDAPPS